MSSSSYSSPPSHNNVDLELATTVDRAAPWFHNFGSSSALLVHMKRNSNSNNNNEDISKTCHHLCLQPSANTNTSDGSRSNNMSSSRDDSTMLEFNSSRNFRSLFHSNRTATLSANTTTTNNSNNTTNTTTHMVRSRRKKNMLQRWLSSMKKL